jgi:HK97 family phage portal protein
VLEEGTDVKTITMTPDDAQFLETRKFARSEIASLFRVPAHMINDLERATFSNIEQQSIEFVVHCIRPWLVRWEQALTRSLLPADSDLFVEFQLDALLRGDSAARAAYYSSMFQVGAASTNDIRALENLNPVADGDIRYVPGNLMRLGSTGVAAGPGARDTRGEGAAA